MKNNNQKNQHLNQNTGSAKKKWIRRWIAIVLAAVVCLFAALTMLPDRSLRAVSGETVMQEAGQDNTADLVGGDAAGTEDADAQDQDGVQDEPAVNDQEIILTQTDAVADSDQEDVSVSAKEQEESGSEEAREEVVSEGVQEAKATEGTLTKTEETYQITVSFDKNADIPAGAVLEVEEISDTDRAFDAFQKQAEDLISEEERIASARFFDVKIMADDQEIIPAAPVEVKIETDEIAEASDVDTEEVKALHYDVQEAEPALVASKLEDQVVTFDAESLPVFGIVVTTLEKTVLASDGHNYKVTVTCDAEAGIPADAALSVEEINGEAYEAYLVGAALEMGAAEFSYARVFDISIVDASGNHVTPEAPVTVDVALLDADDTKEDFSVVHFSGEKELPEQMEADSSGNEVSFSTDGFSAYAIVQGPSAVPVGWTKITTLAGLEELAATGVYIGTTGGYYMTNVAAIGSSDKSTTGIVKTKPAQSYPADAAVRYYFEAVDGTENQFYIYCLDDNKEKRYVKNTGDQNLYLVADSEKTAFTVLVDNNGRFRFQNGGRYWNMWNGANGNHIACWTSPTDGNNYFYLWNYLETNSDPYGLDGKSYGLMYWVDGTNGKALMSSANETKGHLNALSLTVMSKANNSAKLYVPDNSEISFWTFQHIEDDYYHLTATVDGSTKYLKITSSGLEMVSTPDDSCKIQVIPGEGSYAGQISLKAGGKTLAYSGKVESGFQAGGAAGLEWLNLTEQSELDSTYFMTYSASKVGVSDESITNGSRVIVYTRVWNDTSKKYEFYAIDHDGSLVRCYESGDEIEWVGGRLNSMLWNFVEYYWEGTTDPNGYYELYNQYSEKFIAPQKSSGQVLADDAIGINMKGRQNGKYYSPIVAWDDGYYAYAGLKAENGRVVSCPLSEADDFYFAIVNDIPVDDVLHTVGTVDHTQYGITMKMVNFGTDLYGAGNDNNVRWKMGAFLGSIDKNGTNSYDYYKSRGKVEPGLLGTALGEDGYPVTKADNSLADWFADAQEVNHLFIASTYQGTGYFEYDSVQNFAHLDQKTNNFTVYKELAASAAVGQFHDHGHFWPYNDIEAGKFAANKNLRDALGNVLPDSDPRKYEKLYATQKSNTNYAPDYYMGMEVTASFTQTPNGLDDWGHDIIYEFTGDDDFWLFVDGELIIDLGGIHDALAGSVNYRTGEVVVNGAKTTLKDLFYKNCIDRGNSEADAEAYVNELFEKNEDGQWIFKPYSAHTMKIYYLERGAGASNLHMRFNLASIKPGTAQLTKHLSGVDTNETVLAEFPYQILYRTKDSSGNVTEHYLTNAVAQDTDRMKDYVFYKGSTTPVPYRTEYTIGGKTYNDVFILKPEETADINFPIDALKEGEELVDYKIIECGVNTSVYTGVTVNDKTVEGTEVKDASGKVIEGRKDYATDYASTNARSRVVYDNAVSQDALTNLTIQKKLFDVTGKTEIKEKDDPTTFDFRLYLATESGDIDSAPASMHTYHVKDPEGNYCVWDVGQKRIVSLGEGKSTFSELSAEEQNAATFHTSMNGSIAKIPVGYTVEVRDLLVGTKFKLVERPSEMPDGYSFLKYLYHDTEYANAANGVSDTISTSAGAHIEVDNVKGFGLRVNKTWTDADFMSDRDAAYFGIFYKDANEEKLVDGSLREMPYGTSTVYWYYDKLPVDGVTDFSKYMIYEVSLTDPVINEDGKVTGYTRLTKLGDKASVTINGTQIGDKNADPFDYTVSYERGELSTSNNVRVDEVTNSRPGIILKKETWDGKALAGAAFTLTDRKDTLIGSYTSKADGRITEAFLRDGVKYTLTETVAPSGYHGLEAPMTIKQKGGDVVIEGVGEAYYSVSTDAETNQTTIVIKNRPYQLKAVKLDAGSNAPLSGVGFRLFRQITVDQVQDWDPNPYPGYENLVSAEDGTIFTGEDLKSGTYQLRETAPLSGYLALSDYVTFTVSKTGMVTLDQKAPKEAALVSETEEDGSLIYTIKITNMPEGSSLPSTGGRGTRSLYLFGVIVVIAAGGLLLRERHKVRRESV